MMMKIEKHRAKKGQYYQDQYVAIYVEIAKILITMKMNIGQSLVEHGSKNLREN